MVGIGFYKKMELGNIMFPVAALNYLAYKCKKDICYLNIHNILSDLVETIPHESHAMDYLKIFKNIDFDINKEAREETFYIARVPFEYTPFTLYDGLCYLGYFQSYKYFEREFVKNLFEPSFSLEKWDYLFKGTTCSVHVRRGDYLQLKNQFVNLTMDYYDRALSKIKADRYLVFSDDIEWCKENFKGDFIFVHEVNYIDMFLMSRCNYNVISNSSFAWWGAYLGSQERVIAPKDWFVPGYRSSKDLIPDNWEVI